MGFELDEKKDGVGWRNWCADRDRHKEGIHGDGSKNTLIKPFIMNNTKTCESINVLFSCFLKDGMNIFHGIGNSTSEG